MQALFNIFVMHLFLTEHGHGATYIHRGVIQDFVFPAHVLLSQLAMSVHA